MKKILFSSEQINLTVVFKKISSKQEIKRMKGKKRMYLIP